MKQHIAIAIDGPAGAGKSSVARRVAEILGAIYLDTGAMYRAMGLYMCQNDVNPRDAETVAARCGQARVEVRYINGEQRVFLDGEDVSEKIRTAEAGAAASAVSSVPAVREALVPSQQDFARRFDIVMDGRDIGTKVLPDAPLKVFLTASAEERARRRVAQLEGAGKSADFNEILAGIQKRDHDDSTRAASPLVQAADAVLLDSTNLTIDEVVDTIVAWARERDVAS